MVVLLDPWIVLVTFKYDTILHILFYPVVLNDSIRPKPILGENVDPASVTSSDFVHNYIWICANSLYTDLALYELTQLNLSLATSLDFDSRAIDVVEQTPDDAWLGVDSLQVYTYEWTVENFVILDLYSAVSLWNDMHSSLLEIRKPTVWNLSIWVDWKNSSTVISLVSNEVTSNEIIRCLRKRYNCWKLLVKTVWDSL